MKEFGDFFRSDFRFTSVDKEHNKVQFKNELPLTVRKSNSIFTTPFPQTIATNKSRL